MSSPAFSCSRAQILHASSYATRRLWLRYTGSRREPSTRPCSQCGRGNADTAETGSRTSSPRISIDLTFPADRYCWLASAWPELAEERAHGGGNPCRRDVHLRLERGGDGQRHVAAADPGDRCDQV